jgi:hypothetical protein
MRAIFLLFVLSAGCATPNLVVKTQSQLSTKTHSITYTDLKSGERFYFNEPGAAVYSLDSVVFGKATTGQFISVYEYDIESYNDGLVPNSLDSAIFIRTMKTKNGTHYQFDSAGGQFFRRENFVAGRTEQDYVMLPLSHIDQSQILKNPKAVEASKGITKFFETIGIVALLVGYSWLEVQAN